MTYNKTTWVNGSPPALNATNLNHIEQGITEAHEGIAALQAAVGAPLVATNAAQMTDTTKIYVYTGSETGYTAGNWYYYGTVGTTPQWVSGGVYQSQGIGASTITGSKLSEAIRDSFYTFFQNCALKVPNSALITDIYHALYDVELESIDVVLTLGTTYIYTTDDLDRLKQYLTVTAHWADDTTTTVNNYTLSGTLTVGSNTITVTYQGKTDTFSVTAYTGFYYTPDRGLLTAQNYLTVSSDGTAFTLTETVVDDYLKMYAAKSSAWGNKTFDFSPVTFTNSAYVKVVFNITSLGYISNTNTTSSGYFYPSLSDGTGLAFLGFTRVGSNTATPIVRYSTSSDAATTGNSFTLNTWHTVEVSATTNSQTVILDGTAILTDQPLCTQSNLAKKNRWIFNASNTIAHEIHIRSIEFRSN